MPYPDIEEINAFGPEEYFVQTEVASYMTFRSIVKHLGKHRRRGQSRIPDRTNYSETYRPLTLMENPLGAEGSWTLHFKEDVSSPTSPDLPIEEQPNSVRPNLVVMDTSLPGAAFLDESFKRPAVLIHAVEGGYEFKYADPEALLRRDIEPQLVEQARYVSWLMLAQQEVLGRAQTAT